MPSNQSLRPASMSNRLGGGVPISLLLRRRDSNVQATNPKERIAPRPIRRELHTLRDGEPRAR